MVLVDTDVPVDFLRGCAQAVRWFERLGETPVLLCGLSALELLEGCRHRKETDRLPKLLATYRIGWPGPRDFDRVLADFAVARVDRKIGILDVLIGETAVGLGLPLHTFSVRHFRAIPVLHVVEPYPRNR